MHFSALDWTILVAVYVAMVAGVLLLKPFMRSVADFLAAGRTAGRYLLSVSQGVAALGAITVVGYLEQNFVAGFAMSWWALSMGLVILVIAVSGWVIYRFRSTRSADPAGVFRAALQPEIPGVHGHARVRGRTDQLRNLPRGGSPVLHLLRRASGFPFNSPG